MAGIEFENDYSKPATAYSAPQQARGAKGLAGLLVRSGVVKTTRQADVVFIAVILVSAVVIWYLWTRPASPGAVSPSQKYDPVAATKAAQQKYGIPQQ